MKIGIPPTLEELEKCQQKMINDIREAERLYGTEFPELRTLKIGLKYLKELIDLTRVNFV